MAVERPTFHESWYRVADLHPRLRSTVQISRQHFRSLPWHVVQDHTNNAFFRLAEPAYRFIGLLDGKRSVGDAWTITTEQLGDEAPTQGEVIQLLGQLYTANLLQAEVPADTHTLFARYKKRKQREISGYLMNIMFARLPIFDPDAFLNKWLPLLGWIFSPVGLLVWIALIALGLYSIVDTPSWQAKITSHANSLLSPDNLVLLYIAFALIKACHEMGHAIACKKFGRQSGTGGEVHIIGIMFLVFTPVPYVDASSSWALKNKWHRAIVGAAGMWVELAIASVAAMVWTRTNDAHWLHSFAYNVMFVASFSTVVFNANPLLRYDGYYILSDLLEIPNLATRGKDYIFYLVKRYVWNVRHARNPAHGFTEQIWLFIYAIASFIMRCFVTFSIMFYLTGVLNGTLIILATGMAIAGLFTWAAMPIGKFLHYLATNSEISRVRPRAMMTSALVVAAIVAAVGFIPLPDHARAQAVIEPENGLLADIYPGGDGEVQFINTEGRPATDGNLVDSRINMPLVKAGDTLLKVENRDLSNKLAQAQIELDEARVELRTALTQDSQKAPEARIKMEAAQRSIDSYQKLIDQLEVRSSLSGVLIMPNGEDKRFAFLKRGDRLGVVADIHNLIAHAVATNDLAGQLTSDNNGHREVQEHVEIRVMGRPDILLTGDIYSSPPAGSKDLPSAALGFQSGGTINTAPDDAHGTKAVENFFEVRINHLTLVSAPPDIRDRFQNSPDLPLFPGQRVVVRFNLLPKPLAVQVWTSLRQMFQQKFQL